MHMLMNVYEPDIRYSYLKKSVGWGGWDKCGPTVTFLK